VTEGPVDERDRDRQTEKQRDRYRHRQTEKQAERHKDTDRQRVHMHGWSTCLYGSGHCEGGPTRSMYCNVCYCEPGHS